MRYRCPHCGRFVTATAIRCPSCKKPIHRKGQQKPKAQPDTMPPAQTPQAISPWTLFLSCLFLGYFGVHRFIEGKIASGVIWILTLGLFGIGWIVDTIILFCRCLESLKKPVENTIPEQISQAAHEQLKPRITMEEPQPTQTKESHSAADNKQSSSYNDQYAMYGYLSTPDLSSDKASKYIPTNKKIESALSDYTVIRCVSEGALQTERKITHISALRVRDNKIVDTYDQKIGLQPNISDAPMFGNCINRILGFIGNDCIVGYNLKHDLRVMNIEMQRIGRSPIVNDCTDIFAFTKLKVHEAIGGFTLRDVYAYYSPENMALSTPLDEAIFINYVYQKQKPFLIYDDDANYYIDCAEWNEFNKKTHQIEERERAKRAEDCKIISLDKNEKRAKMQGSSGEEYDVTLSSCACPDFAKRNRPCKHMYRLAAELDLVKIVEENG